METVKPYVIGIDFGTTYSGVAWAWSGAPDDVSVITNWKTVTSFNAENAKVPTEIYYGPNTTTWGYEISPENQPIRWFKLLLVGDRDLRNDLRSSAQVSQARDMVRGLGKTPVEVIGDYLGFLWKHTLVNINKEQGQKTVQRTPFKVWLTVPAIWDHAAQDQMMQAARRAGILDPRPCGDTILNLVSEPEAAALATLQDFSGRPIVELGDIFVVCDAGGGTVDLISYRVTRANPLIIAEYVEGTGKLCGAVFIDQAFSESLEIRVGKERWKRIGQSSLKKLMNGEWENGIKRSFDGSGTWTITLPPEAFGGTMNRIKPNPLDDNRGDTEIRKGELILKSGHVKAYFEKVTREIRTLINAQVNSVQDRAKKMPKAIMLVGGLGSCNYLYKILDTENSRKDIEVLQPRGAKPWTAICRGAVIKGLNENSYPNSAQMRPTVSSRISRMHYGFRYTATFVEGRHDPRDRTLDDVEGLYVVQNEMQWYLNRGQDMKNQEPVRWYYYRLVYEPKWDSHFVVSLWQSRKSEPPTRYDPEQVFGLCNIDCTYEVPFHMLKPLDHGPSDYRRLNFNIEMTNDGAALRFKVYVDGSVIGEESVNVRFEMDSVLSWENLGSQLETVRL